MTGTWLIYVNVVKNVVFSWIWILTRLPSGYVKIAIENGPFIVDPPIQDCENCDFP